MLGENEKETQLAYQLEDRIIRIQECDGGYDYSIMDKNYREIDGGVYDDPDADIHYVLLTIAEELKMYPDTNGAKGQITMESKLVPGLYACGEVLDIDGDCGGYNLQWAWSSGRLAGINAGKE